MVAAIFGNKSVPLFLLKLKTFHVKHTLGYKPNSPEHLNQTQIDSRNHKIHMPAALSVSFPQLFYDHHQWQRELLANETREL